MFRARTQHPRRQLTHLEFRQVVRTADLVKLGALCAEVGQRSSARNTEYCFDP